MILKGAELTLMEAIEQLARMPADAVEVRFYRAFDDDQCTQRTNFGMLVWMRASGELVRVDTLERWEPSRHKLEDSTDCWQLAGGFPAGPPS